MLSKCPHCKGNSWELHTESPNGANFKINFIRCMSCKAPIGVMDYYDVHSDIKSLHRDLSALESKLNTIEDMIRRLQR
jgi:hypothetical protein